MRRILLRLFAGGVGLVVLALCAVVVSGLVTKLPGEADVAGGQKRNQARYLTMRDGVRIAVDIWLPPQFEPGKRYPTVMNVTRYWRATEFAFLNRALIGLGLSHEGGGPGRPIRLFNDAGYIFVRADARGSGASFGDRPIEWSSNEIEDMGEIIDWIAAQSWSNGKVGTYGVSYEGNTALLAAATGRPALKVVAPLYYDFNPMLGLIQPGGAQNLYVDLWGRAVGAMDRNDVCPVAGQTGIACWLTRHLVPGVKPVDEDRDGALLRQAVQAHGKNADVAKSAREVRYIDDPYGSSGLYFRDVSPFGLRARIEASGVPIISHLGWMDAATTDGALSQFMTFSNPHEFLIGAFTHGGGLDTDPFKPVDAPVTPSSDEQFEQIRKSFDAVLKGDAAPFAPRKQIRYVTLGSGEWKTTEIWPPAGLVKSRLYLAPDHALSPTPPTEAGAADTYRVDPTVTNGLHTRWHTNFGGGDVVYDRQREEDAKRLVYVSAPFEENTVITGAPELRLQISSDRDDGIFIAYLEDVAPDGTVRYITEGVLSGDNRRISETGLPYATLGPRHSFLRADAEPLKPGEVTEIAFNLFSTSVEIQKGHRLRLSLAGADKDMFRPRPETGVATWRVERNPAQTSYIDLPTRPLQ